MAQLIHQSRQTPKERLGGARQGKVAMQDNREAGLLQGTLTDDRAVQLAKKPNNTGLPDNLKQGIESLSGMSMDSVKVHFNSSKPAQLNAHAFAQGTDIHIAPGQEKHLPHEAWHVVQQAQGRVRPTMQMKGGVPINDSKELEREADVMGGKAVQMLGGSESSIASLTLSGVAEKTSGRQLLADDGVTRPILLREERAASVVQRQVWVKNAKFSQGNFNRFATQNDRILMADFPGASNVIASWMTDGKNHGFNSYSQLVHDAAAESSKIVAQQNSDQHPYATDAFFEHRSLMKGVNDAVSGLMSLNPSKVVGGAWGVMKGLVDSRTWRSAKANEHEKVRFVRSVPLNIPALRQAYQATKQAMSVANIPHNEKTLYSGHSRAVMGIIKTLGHDPAFTPRHTSKGYGALGLGSYLTDQVDKAIAYSTGNHDPQADGLESIIEYRVLSGRVAQVADKSRRHNPNYDLTDPARWSAGGNWRSQEDRPLGVPVVPPPLAHDSLEGTKDPNHAPGESMLQITSRLITAKLPRSLVDNRDTFDSREYLVRNPDQILPVAELYYRRVGRGHG